MCWDLSLDVTRQEWLSITEGILDMPLTLRHLMSNVFLMIFKHFFSIWLTKEEKKEKKLKETNLQQKVDIQYLISIEDWLTKTNFFFIRSIHANANLPNNDPFSKQDGTSIRDKKNRNSQKSTWNLFSWRALVKGFLIALHLSKAMAAIVHISLMAAAIPRPANDKQPIKITLFYV